MQKNSTIFVHELRVDASIGVHAVTVRIEKPNALAADAAGVEITWLCVADQTG